MVTKSAYDWVSYVEKAILDLDSIPILGNTPSFSWEDLAQDFAQFFSIPKLKIFSTKSNWYTSNTVAENLGEDAVCLNFSVLPLQGKATLIFPSVDVNSFVTWITEKRKGSREVINSEFSNGLLAYVSAEMLNAMQTKPFFDGFLLRYIVDQKPPASRALGIDIRMEAFGEKLTARLILPEDFRKNWITHHLEKPKHFLSENLKAIEVSCALRAGHFQPTSKEWSEIQKGDFIPIENCQVNPETKKGSLYLTLENKNLFRVRIKEDGIKILEQPIYEEEPMSDENDYGDMLDGFEEESSDSFEAPEEKANLDEAMADMDESPAEIPDEVPAQKTSVTLEKIEQVPLSVAVELTRFKITCEKLMQLKPGNLLELNVQPEKPVNLVANGKKIAEGELIRVGEVLGVRILNIGK